MKRTPLTRRTPLRSTSTLNPVSAKEATRKNALRRARAAVKLRSGGMCEARLVGCDGQGNQAHHVHRRSQGGANHVSNLLYVCSTCHTSIHANPARSYEMGLLRRSAS